MTPARSNLSDLSPSPRPLSPCLTGVGGPLHSWLSYAYVKVQNLQHNTYQTFRPEIEAMKKQEMQYIQPLRHLNINMEQRVA